MCQSFPLVGRLARLGCTRIGSPAIFGERDLKALFKAAKPQVARERESASYRASSGARDARREAIARAPRPPLTVAMRAAA
jgi:hypothetical protein